jgi:UDP-N-acetylmuramoyl-tripeptide--D-alanyl-D-alanine ligase
MKPLTLDVIARVTGGRYIGDGARRNTTITGVVRDNREAYAGCLFLCIRGARADGHDFANKAYDAGAVCCLAERTLDAPKGPYVLVDSTLAAVGALGAYYRSLFGIPVVGVTGSVGKTTAKEMTAAVLSQKYNVLKTTANLNNELGVPLTLLSLGEEHEAAVIEMGISNFGEMSRIAEMVRPDICLMTVIGYSHLESLGNLDGVLRAKSEVFRYMRRDALAVVNGDDKFLRTFDPGIRKITFGLGEENNYRAINVTAKGLGGVACEIVSRSGGFEVSIPAFGSHMVYGALPAAAIGHALGLTDGEIRDGLARYEPVGGRANVFDTGYITVIDDCYNANPNSMAASVRSLASLDGRKVAVLGDMFELGADASSLHADIGVLAGQSGVDRLICCGELACHIRDGFESAGGVEAHYFPSKDALIDALPALIKKGDRVLVKASHGMRFEQITQALRTLG